MPSESRKPPPGGDPKPDEGGGAALAGLGFQFAAGIVLGVLVGQWIDRHYGTNPWGVLVGAFLGFGAGFYSIFRSVKKDQGRGM